MKVVYFEYYVTIEKTEKKGLGDLINKFLEIPMAKNYSIK